MKLHFLPSFPCDIRFSFDMSLNLVQKRATQDQSTQVQPREPQAELLRLLDEAQQLLRRDMQRERETNSLLAEQLEQEREAKRAADQSFIEERKVKTARIEELKREQKINVVIVQELKQERRSGEIASRISESKQAQLAS